MPLERYVADQFPQKWERQRRLAGSVQVKGTSALYIGNRVHRTCEVLEHGHWSCNTRVLQRPLTDTHLSTCQEILPTLQGHVVAILVTSKLHLRLGWLHQAMFNLSQQCLLLPSDNVQISQEVF